MYPIIVIGPPRSGTTLVARVLQSWCGVLMDASPIRPDGLVNPHAWYEDSRLVEMNTLAGYGMLNRKAWTRRFKRFIRSMQKITDRWGMKDPRMIPHLRYALTFFVEPMVIRCHREKPLVVASMCKKLGWTAEESESRYDFDESTLDCQLDGIPHLRIDLARDWIDEYALAEQIMGIRILRHAA